MLRLMTIGVFALAMYGVVTVRADVVTYRAEARVTDEGAYPGFADALITFTAQLSTEPVEEDPVDAHYQSVGPVTLQIADSDVYGGTYEVLYDGAHAWVIDDGMNGDGDALLFEQSGPVALPDGTECWAGFTFLDDTGMIFDDTSLPTTTLDLDAFTLVDSHIDHAFGGPEAHIDRYEMELLSLEIVPEPAAWMLMLSAGVVLRRRGNHCG